MADGGIRTKGGLNMTISELITQLESFERKYGDLPVVTTVTERWGWDDFRQYRTTDILLDLDTYPAVRKSRYYPDNPEKDLPDGPYLRIDQDGI